MNEKLKVILAFSFSFFVVLALAMFWFSASTASVPNKLTMGRLDEGSSLADGNYAMVFNVYSVASGGSTLYTESHTSANKVEVNNGFFKTTLGDLTALTLDFDVPYWLGITIESDSEVSPRIALNSSSYAMTAGGLALDNNLNIDSGTLFVDISNNRVGVGTTSPGQLLELKKDLEGSLVYGIKLVNNGQNTDTSNTATGILFGTGYSAQTSTRGKGALVYATTGGYNIGDFHFLQNSVADGSIATLSDSVMTIKNNGSVGIGTTSPQGLLDVYGGPTTTYNITATNPSLVVGKPTTDNRGYIELWGTTASDYGVVQMTTSNLHVDSSAGGIYLNHYASGNVLLASGGGNVGIGTTNPQSKLQVVGGVVTQPDRPVFSAYGATASPISGSYWVFPSTEVNQGGYYSTSTGKFTAPIAGPYFFSWTFIGHNSDTVFRYSLHVNGSAALGGIQLRADGSATGSDYPGGMAQNAMLNLSAGDEVQIYFTSDSGVDSYNGGAYYLLFSGYFLG